MMGRVGSLRWMYVSLLVAVSYSNRATSQQHSDVLVCWGRSVLDNQNDYEQTQKS